MYVWEGLRRKPPASTLMPLSRRAGIVLTCVTCSAFCMFLPSSGPTLDKWENAVTFGGGGPHAGDHQRITNGFAIGSWEVLTQTALLRVNSWITSSPASRP